MEKFIERGTDYPLRNGKLTIYETNCSCKNIQFHFDQYVLTLMLSGHKTIVSENLKFEFFPGTFFIPERGVINEVSIPNASLNNPTKCLVLNLKPSFIQSVYDEIKHSHIDKDIIFNLPSETSNSYFLSNDQLLIQAFVKLYKLQLKDNSPSKVLIEELIIKEILFRLFSTEGLNLLIKNFEKTIKNDNIYKVVKHIHTHIDQKISSTTLAKIAGMGQTTFFKVFKDSTGHSPIEYIMKERINRAKILIEKNKYSLQEIAYKSGFNSYEYFCSRFKKNESIKPSSYKKKVCG